jgi:hypothetical protein
MAGEWIPIDCNLGTKPEVLELVDVTGEPVEAVVYRLIQLWSWASMNTADGSIRCTPARLRAVAGGDETFWLAVEQVGWVSFEGGHMTITGWDKRFSKSAKARLHDNRRKSLERGKNCDVRVLSEKCPEKTGPEERRGEEKKRRIKTCCAGSDERAAKADTLDGDRFDFLGFGFRLARNHRRGSRRMA